MAPKIILPRDVSLTKPVSMPPRHTSLANANSNLKTTFLARYLIWEDNTVFAYLNAHGQLSGSYSRENIPHDAEVHEIPETFHISPGTLYRWDGKSFVPDEFLNSERDRKKHLEYLAETTIECRNALDLPDPPIISDKDAPVSSPERFAEAIFEGISTFGLDVTLPALTNVVKLLFYAGLEQEERRNYAIRIELLRPHASESPRSDWLRFDPPLELTPQSLIKLAPSLDLTQSSLFVDVHLTPTIWGLGIRNRSLYRWMTNTLSVSGYGMVGPYGLMLSNVGPGHLIAEYGSSRVAEFKRGFVIKEYIKVFEEDGPLKRFLDSHKIIGPPELSSIRDPIHKLVARSARSGCGGVIAVIGQDDLEAMTNSQLIDPGVAIGWPMISQYVNEVTHADDAFRNFLSANELAKRELLTRRLDHNGNILSEALQNLARHRAIRWKQSLTGSARNGFELDPIMSQYQQETDDAIDGVSHLLRPDGALLMSTTLHLYSFASKIKKVDAVDVFRAQDAAATVLTPFSFKSVGTRHRSAAWLATQLPNSCVFVISEDGIVSAIKVWRGRTVIWRPITSDRFRREA